MARTEDTLFDGAVVVLQPARGYRVGIDALILAAFAKGSRPARRVVDLGAGVGAISLALGHLGAGRRFELVERERELVELGAENLRRNGFAGCVHARDLAADGLPPALVGAADLVVCNPPFFDQRATRPQREPLLRAARSGSLEPFVVAAARALGAGARAAFAYPARFLCALLLTARSAKLEPKRMRLVHAHERAPARLALVELKRAKPGGLVIEPPLFEWSERGVRSVEVAELLASPKLKRIGDRT